MSKLWWACPILLVAFSISTVNSDRQLLKTPLKANTTYIIKLHEMRAPPLPKSPVLLRAPPLANTTETFIFNGTQCYLCPKDQKTPCTRIAGEEMFEKKFELPTNMDDFEKMATMATCELVNYELFKHCAKAHLYGKDGYPKKGSKIYDDLDMANNASEIRDVMMALVEGCILCEGTKDLKLTIKFNQVLPERGSLAGVCEKALVTRSTIELEMKDDDRAFVAGGILWERWCPENKAGDKMPMEFKYEEVHLEIVHNCGGAGKSKKVVLPKLVVTGVDKNAKPGTPIQPNFEEFRHLEIDLGKSEECVVEKVKDQAICQKPKI